jgi:type IV secretion system protein VirD4
VSRVGDGPATDVAELIRRAGTIYLLGREDPYASASPLMTAVAELFSTPPWVWRANRGGDGCAHLDELPSTAPLPTLRTRMANERALGVSLSMRRKPGGSWPRCSVSSRPEPCSA